MVSLDEYRKQIKVMLETPTPTEHLSAEYGMAGDAALAITGSKAFISSAHLSKPSRDKS